MANEFWTSDRQWAVLEPLVPMNRRGVKPKRNREIISGIVPDDQDPRRRQCFRPSDCLRSHPWADRRCSLGARTDREAAEGRASGVSGVENPRIDGVVIGRVRAPVAPRWSVRGHETGLGIRMTGRRPTGDVARVAAPGR